MLDKCYYKNSYIPQPQLLQISETRNTPTTSSIKGKVSINSFPTNIKAPSDFSQSDFALYTVESN